MKTINTISWLALIVLFAVQPADRALWVLLMLVAAIVCYITRIAEKQNDPARSDTPHEVKR